MALFKAETTCRPGALTKAKVGKALEIYLRRLAENQGHDPASDLTVSSQVEVSSSRSGSRLRSVEVVWIARLILPESEALSESGESEALEALLSDLGSS